MHVHDLLVVGGVGVDTIVHVPALPLPMADSIHVGPVIDYVAHTGNGVALAAHALGRSVKLIDFIGADRQAELILARYQERGLDFSHLVHASGTRRSVNLVDPGGRRLSLYDGRHPDALRMPAEFYLPFLRQARHAHFSIMPWARELYDDAQALGTTVSTDLHDWNGSDAYYHDFAYRSDLVFLSAAALGGRHAETMHDILNRGRAKVVVAMAGEQGAYLLARAGRELLHFGCVDLGRTVVDSNGAGDAFVAAFLDAYFARKPLAECMRMGAISGAFACSIHGTAEQFLSSAQLAQYAAALAD